MDKVAYWLDLSNYDIETAEAMMATRRLLYVGFMCHQTIEKVMKAYWSNVKPEDVPYTHNLAKLAQSSGLISKMDEEQIELITELMPLNIEARYPHYKQELQAKLTLEYCQELLIKTKNLKLWIEKML